MKVRIAKDFFWEMGHRLPYHDGGCRNIHGHSYKMTIELLGTPLTNGMVLDYFIVKEIVQPIVDSLDHSFLCDSSDTETADFLKKHTMKHTIVPFYTTAENIAQYVAHELIPKLSVYENLEQLSVRVYETARSFAEVVVPIVR